MTIESLTDKSKVDQETQIPLPLPSRPPRYDRDSFLIAPSNEIAWRAANAWRESDEPSLVICGPTGSGKTHLAKIIAGETGIFLDWRKTIVSAIDSDYVVFDEMPAADPRAFLTLIEDISSAGKRLILVGVGHPGEWAMQLNDLKTRLEAIPRAALGQPDEALLRAVIVKSFSDRQIGIDAAVVEYAAPRLSRTFTDARWFVDAMDAASAAGKRKISIALAREILASRELNNN